MADDGQVPGGGSGPGQKGADGGVRGRLAELASRKRREQEDEDQSAQKKQKGPVTIDFGDSDEEDDALEGADEGAEEEEAVAEVNDEDRAFIDDVGVAPENQIDFGDEEEEGRFEEAQEDISDELDRMFKKNKRRQTDNEAESKSAVENLLAQMEVAVEEDMKNYEEGKAAVHKLRLLGKVEEQLARKKLHGEFLDGGLLGVLKAWIEPMGDGTLPNTKIRSAVLRILSELPIDCSYEDRKTQLKRSGLGRVVLFLSKVSDEIPSNRKLAKILVEKWSRPILASRQAYRVDDSEQERTLAARRARLANSRSQEKQESQEYDADGRPVSLKPGDPGFRWHAAIPEAATLDYVRRPESKVAFPETKASSSKDKAGEHKLTKKLKGLSRQGQSARAADVSVEGRNVTLRH